ncbi:hypothetical protein H4R99_004539 [Coemansia sp. RSA 1722]|nr:hypothetical protein IWW45_005117 [Coemansia sp. RSA 485]KAJ2597361.1 hypothetical protein H4R99_004539 [Coemansia sp. RSA 1722]
MTVEENAVSNQEARYSITSNISYIYQVYCSYILVYRNVDKRDDFMNAEFLQKSLTELTRKYYKPVAGWFNINEENGIDVVVTNDKFNDPPFATQTLNMSYDEAMEQVRASNDQLFVPHGPLPFIEPDNQNIPMVLVKMSYLESNEAAVMGITYHHSLMDGSAFWLFMYNWANLAAQMATQDKNPHIEYTIPCPPSFGVPSLSHLHDPSAKFDHTEYTIVDSSDCSRVFKPGTDTIKENILHISIEGQHKLRDMAKEYNVSFTAIICAVIWKEMSRIRVDARPSSKTLPSLFTCAVNPRASLGLSPLLCASPVVNLATTKTLGELAEMDLEDVAKLVLQTITKGTSAYVCSSMDFLVTQRAKEIEDEKLGRDGKKVMLAYVRPAPAKCTISSSRNFPIYQTDFGFGSPEYVRPPYLPFDGCMRIWPTPQSKGNGLTNKEAPLEVYLSLPDYVDLSKSSLLRPFVTAVDDSDIKDIS